MYSKISLTLLLLATTAIAIRLWMPQRRAVDLDRATPTEAALLNRTENLDLQGLTREEAVALIQKQSGITLAVDWKSVARHSYPLTDDQYRTTKLNAWVGHLTIVSALKIALGESISIQADGNIVKVAGNRELQAEEMTVRAYDIGDLVSDNYWHVAAPPGQEAAVKAARMNQLREVIVQHSSASGWRINYLRPGNAGGNASISVLGTCVIATQTTDGHWAIARALEELRHPVSADPR